MEKERFSPKIDKLYVIIVISTAVIMLAATAISLFAPYAIFIMLLANLFVSYFLISPIFGYVELREETVFLKFGFILKREIPYKKIRGFGREHKWYADSILALKNSLDHVNIKYNTFDTVSVSVKDNDALIMAIEARISKGIR